MARCTRYNIISWQGVLDTTLFHGKVYSIQHYFMARCTRYNIISWRGVLDTTLCDKVCQLLAAGQWFSLGTSVSSTNKTDRQDISEILLKVALNTINQTKPNYIKCNIFIVNGKRRRDLQCTVFIILKILLFHRLIFAHGKLTKTNSIYTIKC